MTSFTSGTQALQNRKVNHDPEPYISEQGTRQHWSMLGVCEYAPRPEYDVLDNPILAELRHCTGTVPQNARWYLELLDGDVYDWRVVPAEQIDHARRVLTKLAALA